MKIVFRILGIVFFVGLTFVGSVFAEKEQIVQKPFKLAILDIDRVIRDAAVSIYIQKTVEKHRASLQKDVEGYEEKLRKDAATLKELQNKNDPSYDNKKKTFENSVTDVQKRLSGRAKILEKVFRDARLVVIQKIMTLVSDLAESNGYTLVIPKNIVMYQEEVYEITDMILSRLDEKLPTIDIKLPKGA